MKAYIIRFELEESDPLVWRRIVMPAGATYNRLHDVIQTSTNFLSGYPSDGYHFYEFDLVQENRIVTNNEEALEEHKHFKKNMKVFEERLKGMPPDNLEFEEAYQERLKKEVRMPSGLKIDDYLEKYGVIRYNYDFGGDWHFTIRLEETVEDYYFGYPTLLDGRETAPPEDVGGISGFYEFMEIYKNPHHPEHDAMKEWAESMHFREYNPDRINYVLKMISYKKTEWGKVNHERYRIIEDKYRKE